MNPTTAPAAAVAGPPGDRSGGPTAAPPPAGPGAWIAAELTRIDGALEQAEARLRRRLPLWLGGWSLLTLSVAEASASLPITLFWGVLLGLLAGWLARTPVHRLRIRQPGGFVRGLPPLQTMESLLFEMIAAGFVLLTLALLSGFAFLTDMFAQHLVHKTVLSCLGWVVFGALLLGRFRYGWRGRTAIIWTLSGFVLLILAYFGSKAVLQLILHRPPG